MRDITRRQFFAVVTAAVALLPGCSAQPSQSSQSTQKESDGPAEKSIGDVLAVTTKKGDVNVTVNGFDISQSLTEENQKYKLIDADHAWGILMLTVENVSYEDENNPGWILLDDYVLHVKDTDGVSLAPLHTGQAYGDYEASGAGAIECDQGEKIRVAVCYSVDPSLSSVDVVTIDNSATVHVDVVQS
ncbi:MAG: hypothetical protein ACFWTL_09935 [Atopobium sp.]|jgi:hypothetical protein